MALGSLETAFEPAQWRTENVVIRLATRAQPPISHVIPCCEGSYTCWLSAKKIYHQVPTEVYSWVRDEHTPAVDGEVRRFPQYSLFSGASSGLSLRISTPNGDMQCV